MNSLIEKAWRALALMAVCGAAAALINFLVFFLILSLFAGEHRDEWSRAYASNNGLYFGAVTVLLGLLLFPLLRKLRTS